MESTKDLEIDNTKEEITQPEGEDIPFLSLIIKDLNDLYIRYDVNIF
jgi:hypothetical protein